VRVADAGSKNFDIATEFMVLVFAAEVLRVWKVSQLYPQTDQQNTDSREIPFEKMVESFG
jgi:hypothetical protein